MNILFHHRTRGRGAEGVHIRGVVKGLRELGHKVSILSLPGSDPEDEELAQPKQDSLPAKEVTTKEENKKSLVTHLTDLTKYCPEFVFEFIEIAFNLISCIRLRKSVKEQNISLIYERYSLFLFASVWWAKKHNIPIVLEINDSCLVHRVRHLTFTSLARKIEKWIFTNATGLVFISSHFQNLALQNYGDIAPSVISPNAADLDKFVIDHESGKQLREKL